MAFLIRSNDGRTTICTACAEAAAQHATRLRQSGSGVKITDFNGERYGLAGLHRHANALRATQAKILRAA